MRKIPITKNSNVLEVFTDFVCPWCYLGEKRLQRALCDSSLIVQYIYFPLHPETSVEGITLEQLFTGRGRDVARDQQQLAAVMRNEGLAYGTRTHTYNSRRAQELAKYIEMSDSEEVRMRLTPFRSEVFLAYFLRGENIAKRAVLQGICRKIGLVDLNIEKALSDSLASDAIDDNWAYCRNMNVTGVPAFRFGGRWIYGCQSVDALESLIRVERSD